MGSVTPAYGCFPAEIWGIFCKKVGCLQQASHEPDAGRCNGLLVANKLLAALAAFMQFGGDIRCRVAACYSWRFVCYHNKPQNRIASKKNTML